MTKATICLDFAHADIEAATKLLDQFTEKGSKVEVACGDAVFIQTNIENSRIQSLQEEAAKNAYVLVVS